LFALEVRSHTEGTIEQGHRSVRRRKIGGRGTFLFASRVIVWAKKGHQTWVLFREKNRGDTDVPEKRAAVGESKMGGRRCQSARPELDHKKKPLRVVRLLWEGL